MTMSTIKICENDLWAYLSALLFLWHWPT